jgi:hypothetical protein
MKQNLKCKIVVHDDRVSNVAADHNEDIFKYLESRI